MTRKATVLVGVGPLGDTFHDVAATSHQVAGLLEGWGWQVNLCSTLPALFRPGSVGLERLGQADLLVINAGRGDLQPVTEQGWDELLDALQQHRRRGTPLLGLHAAANTLHQLPGFGDWLGGRWVDGVSTHPPIGTTVITPTALEHPITAGLEPFEVFDERYSWMQTQPELDVLVAHRHQDVDHPLVWAASDRPVVYDALGHGVESFRSPGRVELLRREVEWLASSHDQLS